MLGVLKGPFEPKIAEVGAALHTRTGKHATASSLRFTGAQRRKVERPLLGVSPLWEGGWGPGQCRVDGSGLGMSRIAAGGVCVCVCVTVCEYVCACVGVGASGDLDSSHIDVCLH